MIKFHCRDDVGYFKMISVIASDSLLHLVLPLNIQEFREVVYIDTRNYSDGKGALQAVQDVC